MKHKHHVIPLHMGGTDDPSNIVELTIEEHAEAHRKLFEEHGRWQDELAWKGLAKMISKEEIIRIQITNGAINAGNKRMSSMTPEERSDFARLGAKAKYEKHKEKVDATLRANAQRGKELGIGGYKAGKWIWITNDSESKKVLKENNIPNGWKQGRHKRTK